MLIERFHDGPTSTNTYILADLEDREAIIIDPVVTHLRHYRDFLFRMDLDLLYALETQVHTRHRTGALALKRNTGARVALAASAGSEGVDVSLAHNARLEFGDYCVRVVETPGRGQGSVTYVVDADRLQFAFTGDLLLLEPEDAFEIRRSDAELLYRSVHHRLFKLPGDTLVCPAHSPEARAFMTIREEARQNPWLSRATSEAQFLARVSAVRTHRAHDGTARVSGGRR